MTIVIGYVPSQVGEAALEAGLAEAAVRGDDVVILNSPRRRSTVDGELIDAAAADALVARAAALGVSARVDQSDHGDDIVETSSWVCPFRPVATVERSVTVTSKTYRAASAGAGAVSIRIAAAAQSLALVIQDQYVQSRGHGCKWPRNQRRPETWPAWQTPLFPSRLPGLAPGY